MMPLQTYSGCRVIIICQLQRLYYLVLLQAMRHSAKWRAAID